MNRFLLTLLCLLTTFTAFAQEAPEGQRKRVVVNNRVLASVNGKVISVIDLMKKMDMILYQQYPQYLEVPEARYQFYMGSWKQMLSDSIDRELVIGDAEEKHFEVSAGDVREELEEIFGPNMMINLDSAGLTREEASEIVKADITIRRMLMYQVRQRIYPKITPNDVRISYEEYLKEHRDQKECIWRAVSIRAKDKAQAVAIGDLAYNLLTEENVTLDNLEERLHSHEKWQPAAAVTITLSTPYTQKRGELSPALQELFFSMPENSYSKPLFQTSRSDQTPVVRLYYLQERKNEEMPSIQKLEPQLREKIAQVMIASETEAYFAQLHRHFHISKEQIEQQLPANFQPFELR